MGRKLKGAYLSGLCQEGWVVFFVGSKSKSIHQEVLTSFFFYKGSSSQANRTKSKKPIFTMIFTQKLKTNELKS